MSDTYDAVYTRWLNNPENFWAEAAEAVHWHKKWDRVLDDSRPPFYRWFPGGLLNSCYNALDRHVGSGRADQSALIYDSPVTGTVRTFTYRELLDEVARFAGVLVRQEVQKGDRVIVYMPMVPEAIVAMLACARIGAIHSVVFGGFAAHELANRITDARPKVIVSATCGIEAGRIIPYKPLLDKAIELAAAKPQCCIIVQRPEEKAAIIGGRDLDWSEELAGAKPVGCVPVEATDPLYILYTSGTTGMPKGIVRDNGGHLVALKWSMQHIYGVEPGEVYWAASDVGWVVGHSYIVYAPLFNGNTTVLYEGKPVGTPDAGAFWRVISQHGVKVLFTAPTAFRAIKREDPNGEFIRKYDLSGFRTLFLAGERCDPDTLLWAQKQLGVPVIDHWWQTETGWPIGANCVGLGMLPVKPGSCTKPVPGYDVHVLGDDGKELPPGQIGSIVVKLPLPPGCLPTLWNNDEGYRKAYVARFPGYYLTADAGYKDEDGYLWVMTRTDDIINVAGHRLSTGALEEVLASHPDVAECAVLGVADAIKGEIPLGLIVLKAGVRRSHDEILSEVVQMVRERIGAVASFRLATVVKRLPKTRSGKILRGTMKKMADREQWSMPAT
ncbi:MAG TPA: propionyl-CoA synthetase, partial [Candidatus Synoicihabitans sp.]|nr:propionyl-CoA synthetase [Candidatus Synoicihabitans sp.]